MRLIVSRVLHRITAVFYFLLDLTRKQQTDPHAARNIFKIRMKTSFAARSYGALRFLGPPPSVRSPKPGRRLSACDYFTVLLAVLGETTSRTIFRNKCV